MSLNLGNGIAVATDGLGGLLQVTPSTTDSSGLLVGLNVANLLDLNLNLLGSSLSNTAIGTHGAALTLPTSVNLGGILGTDTADTIKLAADTVLGSAVLGGGDDTLTAPVTAIVNGVIDAGDGNDTITLGLGDSTVRGGAGNDHITYLGSGNNVIDGGSGADMMAGGRGDDTYMVDDQGDQVMESSNQGTDTIKSSISYTLPTNVENLILIGHDAVNGNGNELANVLTGNDAANVLNGGAGADRMAGGDGDDIYYVDKVGDLVTEAVHAGHDLVHSTINYTLADNVEDLVLDGTSSLHGTGNALANEIEGNSGNNVLDGGLGADTLVGGLGNDTYYVDNAHDSVVEAASGGTDLVYSTISYTLGSNVENLHLTGMDDLTATGNALANTISGNLGDNLIDGGAGADHMNGSAGNDTYIVDNTGDRVYETAGAGTDTILSSVNYTASNNVENLTLTGSATQAIGNTLDNVLRANDMGDTLDGKTGNDTIVGGAGNDTIIGGAGRDVVTGGAGADSFVFKVGDLGGSTASTADEIRDFSHADGDKINLSALDADSTKGGNQAFSFIGDGAFTGHAGQLSVQALNGAFYLEGDVNGDSHADFMIKLDALAGYHLTASDLVL